MNVYVGKAWYIYGVQSLASGSHKDSWDLSPRGTGYSYFNSGDSARAWDWPGDLMLSRHTAYGLLRLFLDNSSYLCCAIAVI